MARVILTGDGPYLTDPDYPIIGHIFTARLDDGDCYITGYALARVAPAEFSNDGNEYLFTSANFKVVQDECN